MFALQAEGGSLTQEQIQTLHTRMGAFAERYVEIGSGSGGHLVARAKSNNRAFHLGFELRYKRAFDTARKSEREQLNNIMVVRGPASELFKVFNPNSLDGIYLNFPDPWERRRWHKHRILNSEFLQAANELLSPSGFLSYKTDHSQYFEETLKLIEPIGLFEIERLTRDLYNSSYLYDNVTSEFEMLFRSKGLPVNFLLLRKKT
jgi:tRNA (guanine-N7-)-methyltransferase